jgi:short-subunit dehydrogenase
MSKWAVVTGATAGIGESFTRILAHDGFNIVLVARDLERMKERAAHLESQFKVQTAIIQADLATDDGCAKVEQYLRENQIEVLINNAGFGINKAFSVSDCSHTYAFNAYSYSADERAK